jgi:hypothetical protein
MPTRIEIIAQIDSDLSRLERARDFLVASLAESTKTRKATKKAPAKEPKQPVPAPATTTLQKSVAVAAPAPPPQVEPQIRRVPPKRRLERRQTEKVNKSGAALSGLVPVGPVAVSANEARKVQERSAPPPPPPIESATISSERTLGSLIQAFERRSGLSGLETP